MGWMYEIVEESFMGRVQSLLSPLTTGFQLLSRCDSNVIPEMDSCRYIVYHFIWFITFVTCLYQAILPSGQKRVHVVAKEM